MALLKRRETISSCKLCIERLYYLSHRVNSKEDGLSGNKNARGCNQVNVGTFLASYVIVCRPEKIFESIGGQFGALEQELMLSAEENLRVFEEILSNLASHRYFCDLDRGLAKSFSTTMMKYFQRFEEWKVPDQEKISRRIKTTLIELQRAKQQIPPSERETSVSVQLRAHIARLREKLRRVAGHAALQHFDQEYPDDSSSTADASPVLPGQLGPAASLCREQMSNEQLAHEVLLDPSFQLTEEGDADDSATQLVRATFLRAFWDGLADDLQLDPPCYARVLRVLAEIRDGLAGVSSPAEKDAILEMVDLEFIKQQTDEGLYSWEDCITLLASVVSLIRQVQSDSRKPSTASGWQELESELTGADISAQPKLLCRCLEFLLGRVNALRTDSANARLRRIAPMIRDHGTEYERGKFSDKLSRGVLTLEHTTAWLRCSLTQLSTQHPDIFAAILQGSSSAFVRAHTAAVMDLIVGDSAMVSKQASWPETLQLDLRRMRDFAAEFIYLVWIAVAAVTAREGFGIDSRATTVSEAVAQVLLTVPTPVPDVESLEVHVAAVYGQFHADAAATSRMHRILRSRLANPSDAVHALMRGRMRSVWEAGAGWQSKGGGPAALVGLEVLLPRAYQAAGRVGRMAAVNRQVHQLHYDTIIAEVAKSIRQAPAPNQQPCVTQPTASERDQGAQPAKVGPETSPACLDRALKRYALAGATSQLHGNGSGI